VDQVLGALVIVFREVLEAGLIIGIVLAATRGLPGRGRWVALGVLAGLAGAGVVALFAEAISNAFEGAGQELLNASVLGAFVMPAPFSSEEIGALQNRLHDRIRFRRCPGFRIPH
jgi:hypothetical protein